MQNLADFSCRDDGNLVFWTVNSKNEEKATKSVSIGMKRQAAMQSACFFCNLSKANYGNMEKSIDEKF